MRAVVRREEPDQNDPNYRQAVINAAYRQERKEYEEWHAERRNELIAGTVFAIFLVLGIVATGFILS